MKILCVSDEVDPIVYSSGIKERFGDVAFVLAAGDLPEDYFEFIVSMLNKPLIFVEGNHDKPHRRREIQNLGTYAAEHDNEGTAGATEARFRIIMESGLCILGLPGSIRYNGGDNQFTDFQMWLHLLPLLPRLFLRKLIKGRGADIILAHAPVKNIDEGKDPCHRGFNAFPWLIEKLNPRWFVHGHVHLYDLSVGRLAKSGTTDIVNAFGHWVIDTDEGTEQGKSK